MHINKPFFKKNTVLPVNEHKLGPISAHEETGDTRLYWVRVLKASFVLRK